MSTAAATGGRFRHIVFASAVASSNRRSAREVRTAAVSALPSVLPPPPMVAYDEETFLRSLLLQAGLNLHDYRLGTLVRRVPACLRALQCASMAQARRLVRQRPELLPVAIDTLLIGVTSFFRDARVFEGLRQWVVTELAATVAGRAGRWAGLTGGGPRVWSVGCSDGSELYSVASLLGEAGLLTGAELVGTDCRERAVAAARAGRCGGCEDAAANVRWGLVREAAGRWGPGVELRAAVRFEVADVLKGAEAGPWDVILCRNMAMYLRPEAARGVWRRLEQALAPGGLLVTGTAERPVGSVNLRAVGPSLYRKMQKGSDR